MCGIAGMVRFRESVDRSSLKRASELLVHRGPDGEGHFIEGTAGLIHRRLSIIDLAGGAQPMFNEDGSLTVVFNGEIYNFMELRRDLQSRGHTFITNSDTETILHGYEEWGTECVSKFRGMFAFALYDKRDGSLFLARDRCGEKPLYYFHDEFGFSFASEIQALLSLFDRRPEPDPNAIYLYLRLGYIPAPYSFYKNVKKMRAGSCLLLRNGVLKSWDYFTPTRAVDNSPSEEELCDELDDALRRAVRKMLISDVPLGAFLSGGLDSSLIVAMMAREGPIPKTFSISFEDGSFDESQYAQRVSEALGTEHTRYSVRFGDPEECLSIMDCFGEPFADSSAVPTHYLSRETRKAVTVALSGDGGDELFGGYRRYLAQAHTARYLSLPAVVRKKAIPGILSVFPEKDVYYGDSFLKSARIFVERAESVYETPGLMLNFIFSHEEVTSLFPDLPDGRRLIEDAIGERRSENRVEALMAADFALYLPDDILVKVDRTSMKNSLEVRAPYLDPDVLDISSRLPLSLKIKGRNQKYLLKKIALRYLPYDIVHRKKHGFMAPVSQWIKKLTPDQVKGRLPGGIAESAFDGFMEAHLRGRADNSAKVFALVVLGRYLK